jgi:peptidyl-prolyl cis-trans isomerase C
MRSVTALAALALAIGVLALPACRAQPSPAGENGASSTAADASASQVLARVGDRTITLGDYVAALDHMDEFDRLRYEAPERRKDLLDEMIDVMLLADEARERGYDKEPGAEQEIREILRDAMLKKAREGAPAPSAIPEDEVRAYFEAHKADYHDPERRRVSAIVLATRSAAEAVLQALLERGADSGADSSGTSGRGESWGELVRDRSVDSEARANVPIDLAGDFGFAAPPGDARGDNPRVPAEVRAAVFEIGQVGGILPRVVPANGKYYVIKFASVSPGHDRTLEEAARTIRVKLARDEARAREEALVEALRKQYPVQIDDAVLSEVRVDAGAHARPTSTEP